MKQLLFILASIQLISVSSAVAADQVYEIGAYYDHTQNSAQCDSVFLGSDPDRIVEFENDGRVKTILDISQNSEGQMTDLEMRVNHKAYVPYFSADKTPILYEDGPVLNKVATIEHFLPSLIGTRGWYLAGYGRAYMRVTVDTKMASNGDLLIQTFTEHSNKAKPTANDIDALRTASLMINDNSIVLEIRREFSKNNPRVPKFFKTSEPYQNLFCQLSRK